MAKMVVMVDMEAVDTARAGVPVAVHMAAMVAVAAVVEVVAVAEVVVEVVVVPPSPRRCLVLTRGASPKEVVGTASRSIRRR